MQLLAYILRLAGLLEQQPLHLPQGGPSSFATIMVFGSKTQTLQNLETETCGSTFIRIETNINARTVVQTADEKPSVRGPVTLMVAVFGHLNELTWLSHAKFLEKLDSNS